MRALLGAMLQRVNVESRGVNATCPDAHPAGPANHQISIQVCLQLRGRFLRRGAACPLFRRQSTNLSRSHERVGTTGRAESGHWQP
jgi:hypothetical protein